MKGIASRGIETAVGAAKVVSTLLGGNTPGATILSHTAVGIDNLAKGKIYIDYCT
jgi:hypothetical protein